MAATTLEAMSAALVAEHAAVWSYAVLGARTSRSADPSLSAHLADAYATHRGRRDTLIRAIRDLGVEPDPAATAYQLTRDLGTPAKVTAVALELETTTAAVYADLVASTYGDQRGWAITALNDAAIRELAFGGKPSRFPGLAEFANR